MARLVPEALPADAPISERLVFDAFSRLADSWTVMWDVPVGMFGQPTADLRQIDFLLLHQRWGVIVVEVKGGAIRAEMGEWLTQPRGSAEWIKLTRSPFKQVADQRYALQRYLTRTMKVDKRAFAHAVAFPGTRVHGSLGPDAPRGLVLDLDDLRHPATALQHVRDEWGDCPGLSHVLMENVLSALRPSFTMAVVSASVAAETTEGLERETRRQATMVESQVEAYRALLSTNRVVVLGGAGTGKTVIAAKLASQLSSTGNRTLLLCHRSAVQAFLHTLLAIRSTRRHFNPSSEVPLQVSAWRGLADAVAAQASRSEVGSLSTKLAELFFDYRDSLVAPFDAIVIDEGQEFTHRQIESLTWLLADPDSSPVYIFADPFQHSGIFSTSPRDRMEKRVRYKWKPPLDAETVMLTTNCRNSSQIAEVAARFYPDVVPISVVDGPPPEFHQVPSRNVLVEAFKLVWSLTSQQGFQPNQVLVVPIGFEPREVYRAAKSSQVLSIAIDDIFRFPLTPKDLRVAWGRPDDVQGLEADVTVVAYNHDQQAPCTPREIYIATSRSRSLLHVVSNLDENDILALGAQSAEERASATVPYRQADQ